MKKCESGQYLATSDLCSPCEHIRIPFIHEKRGLTGEQIEVLHNRGYTEILIRGRTKADDARDQEDAALLMKSQELLNNLFSQGGDT